MIYNALFLGHLFLPPIDFNLQQNRLVLEAREYQQGHGDLAILAFLDILSNL